MSQRALADLSLVSKSDCALPASIAQREFSKYAQSYSNSKYSITTRPTYSSFDNVTENLSSEPCTASNCAWKADKPAHYSHSQMNRYEMIDT